MTLLTICVATGISGCVTAPVVAPPPLPERPAMKSTVKDRNDITGEVGVWMDISDARRLVRYIEDIEAVRAKWR